MHGLVECDEAFAVTGLTHGLNQCVFGDPILDDPFRRGQFRQPLSIQECRYHGRYWIMAVFGTIFGEGTAWDRHGTGLTCEGYRGPVQGTGRPIDSAKCLWVSDRPQTSGSAGRERGHSAQLIPP